MTFKSESEKEYFLTILEDIIRTSLFSEDYNKLDSSLYHVVSSECISNITNMLYFTGLNDEFQINYPENKVSKNYNFIIRRIEEK